MHTNKTLNWKTTFCLAMEEMFNWQLLKYGVKMYILALPLIHWGISDWSLICFLLSFHFSMWFSPPEQGAVEPKMTFKGCEDKKMNYLVEWIPLGWKQKVLELKSAWDAYFPLWALVFLLWNGYENLCSKMVVKMDKKAIHFHYTYYSPVCSRIRIFQTVGTGSPSCYVSEGPY